MELGSPTRNDHPGLCESLVFHQNRPLTTATLRSFIRVKCSRSHRTLTVNFDVHVRSDRNDHSAGIKPADAIILSIRQKTRTSESQIFAFRNLPHLRSTNASLHHDGMFGPHVHPTSDMQVVYRASVIPPCTSTALHRYHNMSYCTAILDGCVIPVFVQGCA